MNIFLTQKVYQSSRLSSAKILRHCLSQKKNAAGKLDSLFIIFSLEKLSNKFLLIKNFLFSFFLFTLFIPSTIFRIYARIRFASLRLQIDSNLVSQNTSNDYKGAVYQNETSISSPARRSEVSPIQNHVSIDGDDEDFIRLR